MHLLGDCADQRPAVDQPAAVHTATQPRSSEIGSRRRMGATTGPINTATRTAFTAIATPTVWGEMSRARVGEGRQSGLVLGEEERGEYEGHHRQQP